MREMVPAHAPLVVHGGRGLRGRECGGVAVTPTQHGYVKLQKQALVQAFALQRENGRGSIGQLPRG